MYIIVVDETISAGESFIEGMIQSTPFEKTKGKEYTTYLALNSSDIIEVIDRSFDLQDVSFDKVYIAASKEIPARVLFQQLGVADRYQSICLYGGRLC